MSTGAIAQEDAIEDVISTQIEALKIDDFVTAFKFASPTIQNLFGTPEKFGAMVRDGYPAILRPAEITFLERTPSGILVWQQLRILDQAGAVHWFVYQMIQVDGAWKIDGVFSIVSPDLSV